MPEVADAHFGLAVLALEHKKNAEVPRLLAVDALLLGVAYADPQSEKNARSDEDAVSWDCEAADVKQLGEHGTSLIDAGRS